MIISSAVLAVLPFSLFAAQPLVEQGTYMLIAGKLAHSHHLDIDHFLKVVECESMWDPNAHSGYALPDGREENSWGIAQWNLDTNTITKEEALNPTVALTKMAEYWEQGRASGWECYNLWNARGWR